ncbi:acyltransferase [uncultured Erythrobacter sp.]|uniref:acyltransferase family protein n=1 Tax=uncultured Erythrobacter sp. TaxID=263913 RepID=UPI002613E7A2|nr:acyltransferase [uncultured Erythrobacter sp.]
MKNEADHEPAATVGASSVKPLPTVIHSLTSLRYLAAAWVLFFHFKEFFPETALQQSNLTRYGFLGVDFFFVLSGFVLAHVYLPKIRARRFDYWSFLVRRIGRIYPLHIVTLVFTIGISLIGIALGWNYTLWNLGAWTELESGAIIRALFANLTLIHAWGATPDLLFNLPSWSISAEWFAYLLFPVFVLFFSPLLNRPVLLTALCIVALVGLEAANGVATGNSLLQATWNLGALRIVPTFALGIALYRLGETRSLGARGSPIALAGAVIALIAATLLAAPYVVIVLCLAGIVFLAADMERHGGLALLCQPFPVLLGEISYSVYLWHFPIGVVAFDIMLAGRGDVGSLGGIAMIFGVLAFITLISWISYKFVEVPARAAIIAASQGMVQQNRAAGNS